MIHLDKWCFTYGPIFECFSGRCRRNESAGVYWSDKVRRVYKKSPTGKEGGWFSLIRSSRLFKISVIGVVLL